MDLINSLSNVVNIREVTVETPDVFEDVARKFDSLMLLAFNSSKQLQDLLPKLVDECGDVDSYNEWEPKDYLNFKDFIVTPEGIRGLTDGFWSWGVAFSYVKEGGILHVDLRCENDNGLTQEISDLSEEVKVQFNSLVDSLLLTNEYGMVITLTGYSFLDSSSYI